jgi:ATP-binding cassette subfamily F protein 3
LIVLALQTEYRKHLAAPGTILLVSHDRYLVNAFASQIWAAHPGELEVFEGTYAEYVGKRDSLPGPEPQASGNGRAKIVQVSEKKHGLSAYELNKRVSALEAKIHELETQVEKLSADIDSASAEGDADRVYALGIAYTRAESELEQALEEWSWLAE